VATTYKFSSAADLDSNVFVSLGFLPKYRTIMCRLTDDAPMTETDSERVVVVGAGVAGCAAARELARDHDVTVLDRHGVAAEATGLAAGLVAPTLFYGDVPDVARHANAFFRDFDGTYGFEFTARDRLDFVTESDVPEARHDAAHLADIGFPATYLDADEVAERYPQFDAEAFAGAVHYGDTGWVDPYTYTNALKRAAEDRGATFELDVDVETVLADDDGVRGVETDAGRVAGDAVVVAAGWRAPDLLPAGVAVPVRPYRTQCVVLEPDDPLDESFPLGRVGSEHLYFRPEHNGDLLVGGAHDTIDDPTAASSDADESFRLDVADFVPSFVDGFETAGFVNGWAGVDTASPDTRPIVDAPRDAPEGLVVATGFNGLGVMVSPVVGQTVRQRLTGEESRFPTTPFDADRFEDVGSTFEYVSTSDV
jgi:glycine/D-amino acid oxidase-like deaminating enzyme